MPCFFILLFVKKEAFEVPNARKIRIDSVHNPNKDVDQNVKEFKSVFNSLFSNKVYLWCTFTMTMLYFTVSGLNFWITR